MTTTTTNRLLLLAASLLLHLGAAQAACDPTLQCCAGGGGAGSTCGGAGPATQGNTSGTQTGGGNPINLITGNKFQREVDLAPLPGVLGLEIVRYYNSADTHKGILGRGWRLSYETELQTHAGSLTIVQADGTAVTFAASALDRDTYTARSPTQGSVHARHAPQGIEHIWTWADGRRLLFDAKGKLVNIRAASGEFVSLRYDDRGWLYEVLDPAGRRLSLNYLDNATARKADRYRGVQSIDSPVGRFEYGYGSEPPKASNAGSSADKASLNANLVKVSYPTHYDPEHRPQPYANRGITSSSVGRLYHYEDARWPTLLTGISVQGTGSDGQLMSQRLNTWAYDDARRGVLSVKGERPKEGAGLEQVTLQWGPEVKGTSTTLLTNSLGQQTTYTTATVAGEPRILQVRGAGCASCGPSNIRYGYDRLGRLTEETALDAAGLPLKATRTELDGYGRPLKVSTIAYNHGKPQPAQWQLRYEYALFDEATGQPSPSPVLIARPSVIPGREQQTRIAYNALGQPTQVTESGFSPVDMQGQPAPNGHPISRTTTYAYAEINGRSLLAQIDGPLPNGPKGDPSDSDITRYQWDARGDYLKGITRPGGLSTQLERDPDSGRIVKATGPENVSENYAYAPLGQLALLTLKRGDLVLAQHGYRYDVQGRLTETRERVDDRDVPRTKQAFDAADRLMWQADALGVLRQASYDSESHLLASRVIGGGVDQQERYAYDKQGRLQRVRDGTGATRELVRDDAGRLIAMIDPLGRWTRYEREPHGLRVVQAANTSQPLALRYEVDERGWLKAVSAEANDGSRVTRKVTHRRLTDDFGREVMVVHPDSGRETRRFDAQGRLVQATQADGSTAAFSYDLLGRLLRRTVTPRSGQEQAVRYVYEGPRLVEIQDPEQTERYAYDDQGRVSAKTITLRLNQGKPAQSTTRYRYDAQGLLAARSLPDGSELQYERNGQGQVVALHRQTGSWAPFGWGRTTLAGDLQRDLVGLTHIRYGNGIQGLWQRSREGVLARVAYTTPTRDTSALRIAFESLMSEARAQGAAQAPAAADSAPGAFDLASDPKALWDSRLLYDRAGNILVQGQFAGSPAAQPARTMLAYDAHDQLAQALRGGVSARSGITPVGAMQQPTAWRYHHDSLGNRLLAQQAQPAAEMGQTDKMAYTADSDRLASSMDEAGRPAKDGARGYQWDSLGHLTSVTQDGVTTAYRYNRLGLRVAKQGRGEQHYLYDEQRHRLAELDGQGRITREYVWLADQLVAVIDPTQPVELRAGNAGLLEKLTQTLRALWSGITGSGPAVAYVHVNHLGAPVAMTDERAKSIWAADYAPFGERIAPAASPLIKTAAPGHAPQAGVHGIRLDLRLPGQWEDEESGLHYNDQRYYDPRAGRYLSPDPLGLSGGLNGYAYVGNNPLGFSDPLGLVLFAFDGTGNTDDLNWLNSHGSSLSNVWQFRQRYQDGTARYVSGPGTVHHDATYGDIKPADFKPWYVPLSAETADMGGNYSGPARIERMVQYFNDEAVLATDDNAAMDVDIVGFSRGAAEARDFANRIVAHTSNGLYRDTVTKSDGTKTSICQKVNFRFMGLFDTVLSTNNSSYAYNLAIPDQFAYVAQAAALNEYRGDQTHAGLSSFGAFPLESISQGQYSPVPEPGKTRIERGFIGAHADIGGGFGANENQLSQVALAWMLDQAKAAGVKMQDAPSTVIANPVIHDKSDNILQGAPGPFSEDRHVRYRNGSTTTGRQAVFSSGMSYPDTQQFISYFPRDGYSQEWRQRQALSQTGTVDMKGYLQWLNNNGYDIHLTVQ